ncbi:MAG: TonB-dependent receptor, partial [Chitinophagaceae bacterium]|nr:TonB-dependent receptor [Chitinophagaceae bacterium]
SFVADNYDETYKLTRYYRTENVPGAFFEYTFSSSDKFNLIAGIRADHNSLFGFFVTPRLHMKYQPAKGTIIRIGTGRGQRTANIFSENTSVFVSSRQVNIMASANGKAYGLNPEVAWSTGIGIDQQFRLMGRRGSIGVDFFRTDFNQQVITDLDVTAREVNFYNLDGRSFANSFQAEINYELLKKLDLRVAYRLFDIQTTYHSELMQRPLIAKHRGFANLAYQTGTWKFDYTISVNGSKRIPTTADNPVIEQQSGMSPSYTIMNAQVSKTVGNKFPIDFYVGVENLTNFYQEKVILGNDDPFGPYFDASLIWGPVAGRMFYGGVRIKVK